MTHSTYFVAHLKMPLLYPDQQNATELYKILVSTVEPRPIAFVSTVSATGEFNLSPFSFFTVASVNPPVLAFNTMRKSDPDPSAAPFSGILKDTTRNLQEVPECVVNIVSYNFREGMNLTSAEWPRGMSEFEVTGFTPVPSECIRPPRVGEAQVAFECVLDRIISFGEGLHSGNLVLARVVAMHLKDDVIENGMANRSKLDPIGRLGGPFYVRVKDAVFKMIPPGKETVDAYLEAIHST